MKLLEGTLGTLTTVAATSAQNIEALEGVRVHITGITTGTVLTEISYDQGTTWALWATNTADGLVAELPPCGRVRCRATVATSIVAVCNFGGRNPNLRA